MSETEPNWEGRTVRSCGEHRTTGGRAWCLDCGEWCYQTAPCTGCARPQLRDLAALLRRIAKELADVVEVLGDTID